MTTDKQIIFWLNRLLEEYTQKIKLLCDEIGILNHQQKEYCNMSDVWKETVLTDLREKINELGWEMPEELK